MKLKLLITLLITIAPLFVNAQSFDSIFRSTDWLKDNLEDENLVILHVEDNDNYNAGHIPGAQLIRMKEYVTTTTDSIYTEMPTTTYLDSLLRARGISDNSKVILYYGGERFAATFRLYFTFDYLGLADNVFILNGGITTWVNNALPLSTDKVTVEGAGEGSLSIKANPALIVDKEQKQQLIGAKDVKMIDARTSAYYSGEKDGDGRYKRPGHIAGAKNITWLDIIDENQLLKPQEELQSYFANEGIKSEDKIITYCHVGLRATVLYTIAKSLGHSVKLYDGSINQWDRLDKTYPVENNIKK